MPKSNTQILQYLSCRMNRKHLLGSYEEQRTKKTCVPVMESEALEPREMLANIDLTDNAFWRRGLAKRL